MKPMGKKDEKTARFKVPNKLILISLGIFLAVLILVGGSYGFLLNRIYPGVFVGNINLSGQTKSQAQASLNQSIRNRSSQPLKFTYQNQTYQLDLSSLSQIDFGNTLNNAWQYGHTKSYFSPVHLNFTPDTLDNLEPQLQVISQGVNLPPIDSSLKVDKDQIEVTPSQNGQGLDEDKLKTALLAYLANGTAPPSQLPVKTVPPHLPYSSALEIKQTLDQIKLSPIKLTFDDFSENLDLPTIISLIDLNNSQSTLASGNFYGQSFTISGAEIGGQELTDTKLTLNQQKLNDYLNKLATNINRLVQEPLFNFDQSGNGGKGKVTQFSPPQEGRELDIKAASQLISQHLLSANLSQIKLPVKTIPPKNQLVNNLGIKELLAEGTSHFYHSTSDRIFNLELAASRVNGTLIAPGDTFSFDATVGDITAATGYHQGYVIESGKTVLDDGGGVCQDPTTLFRAVLKAGLPVVSRTAHAYRVGYYEQDSPPGLDATIYSPAVDFKFKNDTPAYILIQAHADDANEQLIYDLYGTSDGRVSKITTPVILSTSPALPDIHQDDPTLPVGTVKQVDFAVGGANVVFSRTVTRGGQTLINETYHSNYRPWQNVYLVGTKTN
jgi:vancomycin resistance protein YoaR